MFITHHPSVDSLTMITYHDGIVTVSNTGPSEDPMPNRSEMTLATFLREIGIPFKAVRAITSGERVETEVG